jgi:hypothetical protein
MRRLELWLAAAFIAWGAAILVWDRAHRGDPAAVVERIDVRPIGRTDAI